ncbi:hypothetical protein IW148_004716, partial [Coemansia sp. RSA 1199]
MPRLPTRRFARMALETPRNHQEGKAADLQNILEIGLVQPVDECCNGLAGNKVDFQDQLANGLVQPADKRSNGLSHLINKLRMVRASKANSLTRDSMPADKLAVKQTIAEVLYDQVGATKNKITRYKEMAHRIVELLRAHQCR